MLFLFGQRQCANNEKPVAGIKEIKKTSTIYSVSLLISYVFHALSSSRRQQCNVLGEHLYVIPCFVNNLRQQD